MRPLTLDEVMALSRRLDEIREIKELCHPVVDRDVIANLEREIDQIMAKLDEAEKAILLEERQEASGLLRYKKTRAN